MSVAITPAALALLGAGITGAQLARDLRLTPQAISFQLAGKAAETSPELLARIAQLGGDGLASSVKDLIDQARDARVSA